MPIKNLAIISALSYSLLISPSHAISLKSVLGSATSTETSDPLSKGIDSIAGEGTSNILNGSVSPEVALAGKQLGIPTSYYPQLQKLYDNYKGTGSVTSEDIASQSGLSSWLDTKSDLNANTLATGLSALFSQ